VLDLARVEQALRQNKAYLAEAQRLTHTGSWAFNPATGKVSYSILETLYRFAIELDSLNEGLYRGLMLCHQQLGDHSEALQAYRRCRELLTRFLGIPPNAKTQALYHSVRERAAYAPLESAL
jgi:DNA-binding SARP family transcriptional activator